MRKSDMYKNLVRDNKDRLLFWDSIVKKVTRCKRTTCCIDCIGSFPSAVYWCKRFNGKMQPDRNPLECSRIFQKAMRQKDSTLKYELKRIKYIAYKMTSMQSHSDLDRNCALIVSNANLVLTKVTKNNL